MFGEITINFWLLTTVVLFAVIIGIFIGASLIHSATRFR
jgi:hypothetical protein